MTAAAWFTIIVVLSVLLTLMLTKIGPDLVMLAALTVLISGGAINPDWRVFDSISDALGGFANEGAITVGVLFVVAAAIRETGGMSWVAQKILGRPRSLTSAQLRVTIPTAVMSSVMNNTPLVAMMLPVVSDWGKKFGISPAKLMMPLSFAAILGGLCTLIGTSTNIVVHGLLIAYQQDHALPATGMGMFDITLVGIPCAIVGIAYIVLTSRWLLPDRRPAISLEADPREYSVEMLLEPGSPLVGQTIEQAGLRQLVGMYLMEIEREDEVIPMVGPEQKLEANDRLVFVGIVDSVVELQKIRGLRPATNQVFKLTTPRTNRMLFEAVVSDSCRLVGQTIRDGRFRSVYNAVVIAVARNGERVRMKIGDIVVRPGDTLLLEASPGFADAHRNSRDFYLVSRLEDSTPPHHERAWMSVAILVAMVVAAGAGFLSMLNAAMIAAGLMLITRCINGATARRSVDWQVLLLIGAALGLGRAMETTGAAAYLADRFITLTGRNPLVALAVVYGLTMVFTEVMTNNAAAALMFPIAMATATETLGVSPMPFLIAIMIAASCGFATPIGYQTNLMVYGPGGYRFSDFLRFGGLLNLLIGAITIALAPLVWKF
jgi:di/tricarboxylate transporter